MTRAAWSAVALLLAAAGTARAEPPPLPVTPSYAPRAHPPGPGATPDNAGYFYVAFGQATPMAGAGAAIVQAQPRISTLDFHSLAEIAVESTDGQQIIEIGWTVDPGVNNADLAPHLFAFHWVNGVPTCYNGCGWVQVSGTHAPGMAVTPGSAAHAFQIEHRADARWWLTYDGDDMGYYPDTLWSGSNGAGYTEGGFTQWFGEVAAGAETAPCTEMGNGVFGSAAGAATYAGIYTVGSGSAHVAGNVAPTEITTPAAYTDGNVSPTGFGFGGPGIGAGSCTYDLPPAVDAPAIDGPPLDAGTGAGMGGGGCCEAGGGAEPGVAAGALASAVVLLSRRRRRAI